MPLANRWDYVFAVLFNAAQQILTEGRGVQGAVPGTERMNEVRPCPWGLVLRSCRVVACAALRAV